MKCEAQTEILDSMTETRQCNPHMPCVRLDGSIAVTRNGELICDRCSQPYIPEFRTTNSRPPVKQFELIEKT